MTDKISREKRSVVMRSIQKRNTGPERRVRQALHAAGYRFRLGGRGILGNPDLVFASRRKVIFVHGCFWHQHGCHLTRKPKSRLDYWLPKLAGNQARDARTQAFLEEQGWDCLVIWECETNDPKPLLRQLRRFLGLPNLRGQRVRSQTSK